MFYESDEIKKVKTVYQKIYGVLIRPDDISIKKVINLVFLLNEIGLSCGDYRFIWLRGVYCDSLEFDIMNFANNKEKIDYSQVKLNDRAQLRIDYIKELKNAIFSIEISFSDKKSMEFYWMDKLSVITYLLHYVYPIRGDTEILQYLEKSRLADYSINEFCLKKVKKLDIWYKSHN